MTDPYPSKDEYPESRAVRTALEEFVADLTDVVSRGMIERLLFGTVSLADSEVELDYKSEEFTHELLVKPLLEATELKYRPQPKASGTTRDRWPDFELSNTIIPVIGEIKPINNISNGEDQIKSYLSIDGFDTPYGILTDGIEWRVYGPDRSGSGYTIREQVRLDNALQTIAGQMEVIEISGLGQTVRENGVTQMTDFVRTFDRVEFDDWSLIALPKEQRERYIPDDYGSQSSFGDFQ